MPRLQTIRPIKKIWKSEPTIEGAGVHLKRAFGNRELPQLDPFLLLDDFRSNNPADYLAGFPWHPHRGIETITYVLDGDVEHRDSLGNGGVIGAGDVQWMTAGGGLMHQEMPKGSAQGRMLGFQLWANLPKKHKMMPPRYRDVKAAAIPVIKSKEGGAIRLIAGRVGTVQGPVKDVVTDPTYLDVSLPKKSTWTFPVDPTHTVLAYVIEGAAYFEPDRDAFAHPSYGENYFDLTPPCECTDGALVLFNPGDAVQVTTDLRPARFLLIAGKPLNEPVAWYGPIVMNTRDELRQAFEELQRGTFVKEAAR